MSTTFFYRKVSLYRFFMLITMLLFAGVAMAQNLPAEKVEAAICKMKVNDKEYELKANSLGFFPQVSNVQHLATIPIVVTYPQGTIGEKVILSAEEGGSFDNKKQVMSVPLDNEKKCTFNFKVTNDEGLFTITLDKGNDTKVIQLWVGEE